RTCMGSGLGVPDGVGKNTHGRDGPGHASKTDDVDHSAAIRTSGAAALISASTCFSNFTKFFWNMPTSFWAVSANAFLSAQVFTGSSSALSMPGTATGTEKPKYGSVRNCTFLREPSSAAESRPRVTLIGIRWPTP